jgi:hypothetical protein
MFSVQVSIQKMCCASDPQNLKSFFFETRIEKVYFPRRRPVKAAESEINMDSFSIDFFIKIDVKA